MIQAFPPSLPSERKTSIEVWLRRFLLSYKDRKVPDLIYWQWPNKKRIEFESLFPKIVYHMWRIEEAYIYNGLISARNKGRKVLGERSFGGLSQQGQDTNVSLKQNSFVPSAAVPSRLETIDVRGTIKSESQALDFYLAYVANSFVLEMYDLLDWKLGFYTSSGLKYLFGSEYFYRFDTNEVSTQYVTPSSPVDIFVWMFSKGWIQKSSQITRSQQLRSRAYARDKFFEWWSEHMEHMTSDGAVEKKREFRINRPSAPKNLSNYEILYTCYYGFSHIPSMAELIKGHLVTEDFQEKVNGSWVPIDKTPNFIKLSKPLSNGYIKHVYRGCQSASRFMNHILRAMNIPSFIDRTLSSFGGGHCSLVLPEEFYALQYGSKRHELILQHADDLIWTVNNPVLSLTGPYISNMFFSWNSFDTLAKSVGFSEKQRKKPTDKSPSELNVWRFLPIDSDRAVAVIYLDKVYDFVNRYMPLNILVYILLLEGYLQRYLPLKLRPGAGQYAGPLTNYIYNESTIRALTGIAQLSGAEVDVGGNIVGRFERELIGIESRVAKSNRSLIIRRVFNQFPRSATDEEQVILYWELYDYWLKRRFSYEKFGI